jgi:hypothetical protein
MKKIAILLASIENTSVTRCAFQLGFAASDEALVSLFLPPIPYFDCSLYSFIRKFVKNNNLIFAISRLKIIRLVAFYFSFLFQKNIQNFDYINSYYYIKYYNPILTLNLDEYDVVITYQSYLLPLISKNAKVYFILNADYIYQAESDRSDNGWWAYCLFLVRKFEPILFVNSERLSEIYKSNGFKIEGIIPDGPDVSNFEFPSLENHLKKDIGIYFNANKEKGYFYSRAILDNTFESLNIKGNLIGCNSNDYTKKYFNNYGGLSYLKYLNVLKTFKIFLYFSASDGFESPPIDALLSGCFVISSSTPGAEYISKFTDRIQIINTCDAGLLASMIENLLGSYKEISSEEFLKIKQNAYLHSSIEGARVLSSKIYI